MDAKTERLFAWLQREGVTCPKLEIRSSGGERSGFAREDLAARELLLDIPERVIITPQVAAKSPLGRRIRATGLPLQSEDTVFAAFLLDERRRPMSFWRPFLESLPTAFPHLPLFYTATELAWLKGSALLDSLAEQKQGILADDALLRAQLPEFAQFRPEEHLWARAVLSSRRFRGEVKSQRLPALVPVLELLNHRTPHNVTWGCASDVVHFRAAPAAPVKKGTELFVSYGESSSLESLLHYGFIMDEAGHDETALILGVPDGVPEASRKRELLAGRDDPALAWRFLLSIPRPSLEQGALEELRAFLRFVAASPAELGRIQESGKHPTELPVLSPENEARAQELLAEACRQALAGFETTLEQDEELLRAGALSTNARNCVLLRRGEKRVLRHFSGQT